MFDISNNGIVLINRGDTFTLNIPINVSNVIEPVYYTLTEHDRVYFALMEPNQPFEYALIRKVFTEEDQDENDCVHMNFSTEMTEFLVQGNYYYMVKLVRNFDDEEHMLVDTIVPKTKFVILD